VALGAVRAAIGMASIAGVLLAAHASAKAQGRLDARYAVSLAGIPIGKGAWVIDIADDQFTAAASGQTAGLLQVFASGQGSGASRGLIVSGSPVPSTFGARISSEKKTDEIRMSFAGGHVKDYSYDPPTPPHPERIPVTEAHRRNVLDPMTGSLHRVAPGAELFGPDACPRSVAVFDGRMRYDLQFAFKRVDRVKAEKGYEGPAVVCAVYFAPVSGFIPSRAAIRYLIEQRDMEAWLVPVAGTRVMVPFRISVPTPIGLGVMQAVQFVTNSQPSRASGTRTQ
jgi:hypothetical protein